MATLSALHVFPVKSCAAQAPREARVEPRGLVDDRRWMIVDAEGKFMTARKHPRMTRVNASIDAGILSVSAPDMARQEVRPDADTASRRDVTVWGSNVSARRAEARADAWISKYLGQPAHFVHMDEHAGRPIIDADFAGAGDEVSFADGFPLLLISQAALDGLNERLAKPLPMLRFRPNLVVSGTAAHAEDDWRHVLIGGVEFDVVKACTRCVVTTIDFERGEFDVDGEPLRTLLGYRRSAAGVTFGRNLIPRRTGTLRIGDEVNVLA